MKKVFLFFCLCLCSCYDQQSVMQSWIGHSKAEIVQSWGAPQGKVSDENGGEILLYNSTTTVYIPESGYVFKKDISDYNQVYCRSNGVIYLIRYGRK